MNYFVNNSFTTVFILNSYFYKTLVTEWYVTFVLKDSIILYCQMFIIPITTEEQ